MPRTTDTQLALAAIRERNEQPADPGPCRVCGAPLVLAAPVASNATQATWVCYGQYDGLGFDTAHYRASITPVRLQRRPDPDIAFLLAEVDRLRARTHELQERHDKDLAAATRKLRLFERLMERAHEWFVEHSPTWKDRAHVVAGINRRAASNPEPPYHLNKFPLSEVEQMIMGMLLPEIAAATKRADAADQEVRRLQTILQIESNGAKAALAGEGKWDASKGLIVGALVERYTGLRRTYHKAYMGAKRWGMVQKLGYDAKNATHLVRLLHVGHEYLTTGRMSVRRTWDVPMLLEIKRGEWPLDAVQAHAAEWFAKVEAAPSSLPQSIDEEQVNELVVNMVGEHLDL